MTPQQAPQQGGGDIFDEMGALLMQMVEMAGPQWVMEFLQAGMEAAQQGGGEQSMPQQPAPEVMSQGGPQSMPSQRPGGSRLPKGRQRLAQ